MVRQVTAVDASIHGRRKVVGIDLSMTSTGIAAITDDGTVRTWRLESSPPKRAKGDKTRPTMRERYERLSGIQRAVGSAAIWEANSSVDPELVLLEAPSYGSQGAGTWDRAGLWWMVAAFFCANDLPLVIVPPKTRALWATGSGASSKSPIAVHLSRMWPDLDPGISDDEWDAVCLASMGAQHLGWLPTDLARHREQLGRIEWPARAMEAAS